MNRINFINWCQTKKEVSIYKYFSHDYMQIRKFVKIISLNIIQNTDLLLKQECYKFPDLKGKNWYNNVEDAPHGLYNSWKWTKCIYFIFFCVHLLMKDTILWDIYPAHKENSCIMWFVHSFERIKLCEWKTTLGVLSCDSSEWEVSVSRKKRLAIFNIQNDQSFTIHVSGELHNVNAVTKARQK